MLELMKGLVRTRRKRTAMRTRTRTAERLVVLTKEETMMMVVVTLYRLQQSN